jgi:hypothetical protein
VDFSFGGDASGLFGKELDSPEFSVDEIARIYLDYFYDFEARKAALAAPWTKKPLVWRVLRKLGLAGRIEKPAPPAAPEIFHVNGWFDIHAMKNP